LSDFQNYFISHIGGKLEIQYGNFEDSIAS